MEITLKLSVVRDSFFTLISCDKVRKNIGVAAAGCGRYNTHRAGDVTGVI